MRVNHFIFIIIGLSLGLGVFHGSRFFSTINQGHQEMSALIKQISSSTNTITEKRTYLLEQEVEYLRALKNNEKKLGKHFSNAARESLRLSNRLKASKEEILEHSKSLTSEIQKDLKPKIEVAANKAVNELKEKVPEHLQGSFESLFDNQKIQRGDLSLLIFTDKILTDLNLLHNMILGDVIISVIKLDYIFQINDYRFNKIQELPIRHYLKLKTKRLAGVFKGLRIKIDSYLKQRKFNQELQEKVLQALDEKQKDSYQLVFKALNEKAIGYQGQFNSISSLIQRELIIGFILFSLLMIIILILFYRMVSNPLQALVNGDQRLSKKPFLKEIGFLLKQLKEKHQYSLALQSELLEKEKLATLGGVVQMVTHEFKNPLAIMQLSLDDLLDLNQSGSKEGIQEEAQKIEQMIDRMNGLVKNLNTFGRVNNEEIEFDLLEVLENISHMFERVFQSKSIKFSFQSSLECNLFKGVKSYYEIILLNLISNAINANSDERDSIIDVTVKEENGDKFIIVEDNGAGIPEDKVKEIFNPYFSSKNNDDSSGLGLSITRNLVDLLNGRIYLDSNKAGETRFIVQISN